jgi:wyosine [tRNA(Phe)-imidazoG37] synthetase (radical SAM superfamily)
MGEPTLAKNLGEVIKGIKRIRREPVAVLTNSSLIYREDVRKELSLADYVALKLDASSQGSLEAVNRPRPDIKFDDILDGIKKFRAHYKGALALQIMFIEENKDQAARLAHLACSIKPDEVQINTPLRPSGVRPLSKKDLSKIKKDFLKECGPAVRDKKVRIISVYDAKKKDITPLHYGDVIRRRRCLK